MTKTNRAQWISIFLCWLTYTCTYLGKYSYNANISIIEDDYQITHTEAGLVLTFFAIFYGAFQVINGFFCRKYSKKYIVPIALAVSATANALCFFNIPFYLIKYLWMLQAAVLSVLWPIVMQTISENVGSTLMHKAILIMSTSTSVGTLLIYGISALFAELGNYRITFLLSSIVLILVSFIWICLYKPGNFLEEAKKELEEKDNSSSSLKGGLIFIPIVLFGFLAIIADFAKDGLQSWSPVILKQVHGMPDSFSILLTLILPIFGIIGVCLTVALRKRIKSFVMLTILFFTTISLFNLIVYYFYKNAFVMVAAFGILELLIHGVLNSIVSVFPLSMRGRISAGALSGVLNGCSYIGSAASSYLLGIIADKSGWANVFLTLFISVVIATALSVIYFIISSKNKKLKI